MKKALSLLLTLLMAFTAVAPVAFAEAEKNPGLMKTLNEFQAYKPQRDIITVVEFTDTLDSAPVSGYVWDVSVDGDGSVKAWLTDVVTSKVDKVETTTATLVIGAEGKVKLPIDSSNFFENFTKVTEIEFNSSVETAQVTDMGNMFRNCASLKSLDLSSFNTENVTDMCAMFYGCCNLEDLKIDNLNTSKVKDMSSMFSGCEKLETIDVSGFNTAEVINMSSMFEGCSSVESLDLSSFNTKKVEYMSQMFFECIKLTSVDLSSFDTSSVITMEKMFDTCSSLTSVDVSNFETEKVQVFDEMFDGCVSLETLDLSGLEINGAYSIRDMMRGCTELREVRINNWYFGENLTDMSGLFCDCVNLTDIYIYDVGYHGQANIAQNKVYHGVQTALLKFHDNRNIGIESELWKLFFDDATGAQLVFDLLEPYEIRFNPAELNLIDGQTVTVSTSVYPRLEKYELIWESENPEIAIVKNGVVTAVGTEGKDSAETTIKVTIKGVESKEAKLKVKVTKASALDYCRVTFKEPVPDPDKPDANMNFEYFNVSKNGGETYIPIYDGGTFEYLKGTKLIISAQGNAISYVFSIDGTEIETDEANHFETTVNKDMEISVRPINPPSGEEAVSFFEKIINWFRDLFQKLFGWMN